MNDTAARSGAQLPEASASRPARPIIRATAIRGSSRRRTRSRPTSSRRADVPHREDVPERPGRAAAGQLERADGHGRAAALGRPISGGASRRRGQPGRSRATSGATASTSSTSGSAKILTSSAGCGPTSGSTSHNILNQAAILTYNQTFAPGGRVAGAAVGADAPVLQDPALRTRFRASGNRLRPGRLASGVRRPLYRAGILRKYPWRPARPGSEICPAEARHEQVSFSFRSRWPR